MSVLQKPTRWTWTKPREQAAVLAAEDALTDEQIAAKVTVHRDTLAQWKRHPDFVARVASHVAAFRACIVAKGIAARQNRIDALNDRWDRMRKVIDARADDPEMGNVPGGTTGLFVHRVKSIGFGENNQMVDEYEVDTGLLKELRAHEEQAAKELGQWTEKQEYSGPGGAPLGVIVTYVNDWRAHAQE